MDEVILSSDGCQIIAGPVTIRGSVCLESGAQ